MLAAWFAALLALSYVSAREARARTGRCALDGQRIEPIYGVELIDDDRVLERFCCVVCAEQWPRVPEGAWWRVRDEITGAPIDAALASFVESSVVTVPSRHCRTHAFASWTDAMSHAATYGGERIANPLPRVARTPPDAPVQDDETHK